MQEATSSVNLNTTKEVEDHGFNIFTNKSDKQDMSNPGARSSRRPKLSDIHQDNSIFDSSISVHDSSRN